MNDAPTSPVEARARSIAARAQFLATLDEAKHKLSPATLASNTVGSVKDNVVRGTVETVRTKPGTVAAVAGAAMLFLARKPLARLIRSGSDESQDSSNKKRHTEGPST
ncbi:DUF3618 domain-containing protein [Sphingomonas turrisvirgatae]|uniref:DUF3618 domain-containing protein n=1 Tax=Sphingomonas turrisvirgatae TaxID=1888892 RepID=A0A1E3LXR1_9SPHN|nr:DUF3618 domain-containing protein [Sphingomonas turrisvirgatae]ODP38513.1 hypothetical protein BFL28_00205 [Sphingomonas turrisvirgatae]